MYGQFLDHVNHVKGWMGWFCNITLALLQKLNNSKIYNCCWSLVLISKIRFCFRYLVTNLEIFREITCTLGSFPQATSHSSGAWFHECKLFRQPSSPIHLKRNSKKFLISEFQVLCWKYKIFLKSVRTNQHKCSAWGGKK